MLFRWFLDMTPDEEVFVPTVFTHNRQRLAEHGLTQHFFAGVVRQAIDAGRASDEHLAVDVAEANGRSARECALGMVRLVRRRHGVSVSTLAADMGYDSGDFLAALERERVRPHIAVRAGPIRAQDEGGAARRRARAR
jgi:hypothetical protein